MLDMMILGVGNRDEFEGPYGLEICLDACMILQYFSWQHNSSRSIDTCLKTREYWQSTV